MSIMSQQRSAIVLMIKMSFNYGGGGGGNRVPLFHITDGAKL